MALKADYFTDESGENWIILTCDIDDSVRWEYMIESGQKLEHGRVPPKKQVSGGEGNDEDGGLIDDVLDKLPELPL